MGVRLAPALGLVTALVLLVLSEGDFQSMTFGVGTGDPDEVVCVNTCGVLVPDGWEGASYAEGVCQDCECNEGTLACEPVPCTEDRAEVCLGQGDVCRGVADAAEPGVFTSYGSCPVGLACDLVESPSVSGADQLYKCLASPQGVACLTTCGAVVSDGWRGRDDGPNACKRCVCRDGGLVCSTKWVRGCSAKRACSGRPLKKPKQRGAASAPRREGVPRRKLPQIRAAGLRRR
ncbi:hypothetical protein DIPPA_15422 [Diplonema papillatum]|nr:hypothetical protein DIPPA_15422 [Diplonema papillatum]